MDRRVREGDGETLERPGMTRLDPAFAVFANFARVISDLVAAPLRRCEILSSSVARLYNHEVRTTASPSLADKVTMRV
jgi:hypothetical protein